MRSASLVLLLCCPLVAAPPSDAFKETIQRIFDAKDWKSKSFGPARWIDNGAGYTTVESDEKEIARYQTDSVKREVLLPKQEHTIENYELSKDRRRILIFTDTKKVWRQNTRGDYYVIDASSGKAKKLGGDAPASSLMFAKFSPDGNRAAYVRGNNIYVEDLDSGAIRQLTSDGSDTVINGTSDWVYEEEFYVRDGFRWSPDSRSIAYFQFDSSGVRNFALINNTDTLYPALTWIRYPKAGTRNSDVRVGVVSQEGGRTKWMQLSGDPLDSYIARLEWAANSTELVLQHLNRLQNRNDVILANAETGVVRRIHREEDAAWVDVEDDFRWLKDGAEFLWVSERDGWRRFFAISRDGKHRRALTPPGSDAIQYVSVDDKEQWLFYIASPDNATQRYLYRARLDGKGKAERLTPASQPGTHTYQISPDGQFAFHTWSSFDRPPVADLIRLPKHETIRTLEDNKLCRENVQSLLTPPVEFFKVDAGDGATLDGYLIKPRDFQPSRKYPLLVYVYGEPANTTVVDQWAQRNLFHHALANEGYVIATFDNRGTPAPKGREWRKVIYGSVGVLSSKEQTAAARALLKSHPLDPERVAVWGWSGGGSNTLNLLFRSPDLYKVGISVAPVPDQRLYDTIYQERYMGTPESNEKGYLASSAIHFAGGLKGKLLIVHGTGDDNVHYQGTERLFDRLIELGKPFDTMTYPNRSHSISEGKGTSVHLHLLIARYLMENLPPK